MTDALPRCGDSVRHEPTGEDWLVAYSEGEHLAPAGWPDSRALLSDCRVIRRCTDEEHAKAVAQWRKGTGYDSRRGPVLRLYGVAP